MKQAQLKNCYQATGFRIHSGVHAGASASSFLSPDPVPDSYNDHLLRYYHDKNAQAYQPFMLWRMPWERE